MRHASLPRIVEAAVTVFLVLAGPVAAQGPSARDYLPDGLALVVTVRDGNGLLGDVRTLLADYRFDQTPAFATLSENPGFVQARLGLLGLAAAAGTDAWSALGSLAGDEMVFGITPGQGPEAKFIAVSVSRDPAVRDRFLNQVRLATGLVRAGEPDPARSRTVDGVTVFETDNQVLHALAGTALIVCNSEALLKAAIEGGEPAGGLSASDAFRRAEQRVDPDASAWLYVDVPTVRAGAGAEGAAGLVPNPLGGLIFGGAWRSLLDGEAAVAWLGFGDGGARLEYAVDSAPLPETHAGFVSTPGPDAGLDLSGIPGYIGALRVGRNWADLFAEREAHLTLPGVAQLVEFSNGVTTLMGQTDFVDDVLPRFAGPIHIVAARQDLSTRGYRPTPQIPAFAMVIPLVPGSDADGFGKRLYSATLMAMSAGSLIAAQQGQPSFMIEPDRYRDCRILTAEYEDPSADMGGGMTMRPAGDSAPRAGDPAEPPRVNIRYNFAPSAAVVGDRYIVATSTDLLRSVIDGLLDSAGPREPSSGDAAAIEIPALARVLRDNHEELVASRMLEENRTRAQAEREVDAFLAVMEYARAAKLEFRQDQAGFSGSISLELAPAPGAPSGQP